MERQWRASGAKTRRTRRVLPLAGDSFEESEHYLDTLALFLSLSTAVFASDDPMLATVARAATAFHNYNRLSPRFRALCVGNANLFDTVVELFRG